MAGLLLRHNRMMRVGASAAKPTFRISLGHNRREARRGRLRYCTLTIFAVASAHFDAGSAVVNRGVVVSSCTPRA